MIQIPKAKDNNSDYSQARTQPYEKGGYIHVLNLYISMGARCHHFGVIVDTAKVTGHMYHQTIHYAIVLTKIYMGSVY